MLVPPSEVSDAPEFLPSVNEWWPETKGPRKLLLMENTRGYWILFKTPAVPPSALRSQ
jgi:hypothetical protein